MPPASPPRPVFTPPLFFFFWVFLLLFGGFLPPVSLGVCVGGGGCIVVWVFWGFGLFCCCARRLGGAAGGFGGARGVPALGLAGGLGGSWHCGFSLSHTTTCVRRNFFFPLPPQLAAHGGVQGGGFWGRHRLFPQNPPSLGQSGSSCAMHWWPRGGGDCAW